MVGVGGRGGRAGPSLRCSAQDAPVSSARPARRLLRPAHVCRAHSGGGERCVRKAQDRAKLTRNFGLNACEAVVIDGANVCWQYARQIEAARGGDAAGSSPGGVVRPDMLGLWVAMTHPVWKEAGLTPVAVLPESAARFAHFDSVLSRLGLRAESDRVEGGSKANAGTRLARRGVTRPGRRSRGRQPGLGAGASEAGGRWGWEFTSGAAGGMAIRLVGRGTIASRDDVLMLRYAQRRNAFVLSNDKFRDHTSLHKRGFSKWLVQRRVGFTFAGESSILLTRTQDSAFGELLRRRQGGVAVKGADDVEELCSPAASM